MRITYELLKRRGACLEQRDEFRRVFPRECQPTLCLCCGREIRH